MGDGLIERLKAKVIVAESTKGPVKRLRNPDGPEAASRIAELEAKLATAVGALEPFAKAAGKLDGLWADHDSRWNDQTRSGVTVSDVRRAAEALRTIQERT